MTYIYSIQKKKKKKLASDDDSECQPLFLDPNVIAINKRCSTNILQYHQTLFFSSSQCNYLQKDCFLNRSFGSF